jgi:S-methylmethionine-dependent homocysteine/selenocysteine methylase
MLDRGEVVLLDGATGTELQKRGVPMHEQAWSGGAVADHGDVIRGVHEEYIRAGARVITANTFSTGRHSLEPAGLGDQLAVVNRRAVALAREARDASGDKPVAIAGSVCEWVYDKRSRFTDPRALGESFAEQCEVLAEAGVDIINVEMCQRLPDSALAVRAALATGLPVWAGVSCRVVEGRPIQTFDEDTRGDLEPLVEALAGLGAGVLSVMHTPVTDVDEGLAVIRRHWTGPTGVYPESGYFVMPNWQFVDVIDPQDLVAHARTWIAAGARLVGGCCGLGPGHIRALAAALGRDAA